MTEQERRLLDAFRSLSGERGRDEVIYQAEIMVRAQEALRADCGLPPESGPADKPQDAA